MEIKQTVESIQEERKSLIETKLTSAEQKREKEIQKKLEIAKKRVITILFSSRIVILVS